MRLPGVDRSIVEAAKIRDYLVSDSHPVGRLKAVFFGALGYSADRWETLAEDFRVVFVTTNSKDSSWVPWELGMGDAVLGQDDVALLPAADNSNEQIWARQEYLGLYRHIVYGKMEGESKPLWMVYDHRKHSATKLGEWCRSH